MDIKPSVEDYFLSPEGVEITRKGNFVLQRLRPGANVEAFRRKIIEDGQESQEALRGIAKRIRSILSEANSIHTLAQVRIWVMIGPDQLNEPAFFATREATLEFLLGLAVSLPKPAATKPNLDQSFEIFLLSLQVPPLLQKMFLGHSLAQTGDDTLADTIFSFKFENIFDRMEGYTCHLNHIYSEIFGGLSALCLKEFDFSPGDIPLLTRVMVDRRREAFTQIAKETRQRFRTSHDKLARVQALVEQASEAFAFEPIDLLATRTALPAGRIEKLLGALTCPWESQPDFLLPDQENKARLFPILESEGRFSSIDPFSLLHSGISWFDAFVAKHNPKVLEKWRRARDRATERMTLNALRRVFSPDRIFGPVDYMHEGAAVEADGLVLVPPHALAVEVKAHSLTVSGRRGAPERLRSKIGELVDAPIGQAARLSQALMAGEVKMKQRRQGQPIEISKVDSCSMLIVSFERVDPFSHSVYQISKNSPQEPIWHVCIADLLMVTDILSRPSEFLAYLWIRASIGRDHRLGTTMEADILAGFLRDRLKRLTQDSPAEADKIFLEYSAGPINDYFTALEFGQQPTKPGSGIPTLVLEELDRLIYGHSPNWLAMVKAVIMQPPNAWKGFNHLVKKVHKTKTPRRLSFKEPGLNLVMEARSATRQGENSISITFSQDA